MKKKPRQPARAAHAWPHRSGVLVEVSDEEKDSMTCLEPLHWPSKTASYGMQSLTYTLERSPSSKAIAVSKLHWAKPAHW